MDEKNKPTTAFGDVATIIEQNRLLQGQVTQLIAALANKAAEPAALPSGQFGEGADGLAMYRYMQQLRTPLGKEMQVLKACKCPDTGLAFDVTLSATTGKVFSLDNMTLPDAASKHVHEGGLVPDNVVMLNGNDRTGFTMQYRVWIRDNFSLPCMRRYVGKACPDYLRPNKSHEASALAQT